MKGLFVIFLFTSTLFWPFDAEVLPGDPLIIVNKRTNELAFFDHGKLQMKTVIASGKTDNLTPEGLFTITKKFINPYYRKKNIPGGDPRNPRGTRWLGIDAKGTNGRVYGLHGTNDPSSIGRYISQGCIRLPKNTIEKLYDQTPLGTKVLIVHSPHI